MNFFLVFISALILNIANYFPELYFCTWFGFLPLLVVSRRLKGSGFKEGWTFGFFMTAFSSLFVYQSVELFTGLNFWVISLLLVLLYLLVSVIYGIWFKFYLKVTAARFSPIYFALSWLVLEFIRYKLLFFYPAGYLAVTQAEFLHFIQLADLGGFWLLSFVLALAGALIYQVICQKKFKKLIYLGLIVILIFSYGQLRLQHYSFLPHDISVGLITTDIIQDIKWDSSQIENNSQLLLDAARKLKQNQLIIAPETNITFDFGRQSSRRKELLLKIEELFNSPLQFGTLSTLNGSKNKYNSSFLISPEGKVLQRYNKNLLLYFGEKYPAQDLINKILPYHFSSLLAGKSLDNFSYRGLSWKNAICSEILYSDYLLQNITEADFIVNQTNEAWFQDSILLKNLMLSSAVLRAVENRRTVIKVGNLAYDAVVSPAGSYELLSETEIYQNRKIKLNSHKTFYQQIYSGLELLLWLLTASFFFLYLKKL